MERRRNENGVGETLDWRWRFEKEKLILRECARSPPLSPLHAAVNSPAGMGKRWQHLQSGVTAVWVVTPLVSASRSSWQVLSTGRRSQGPPKPSQAELPR